MRPPSPRPPRPSSAFLVLALNLLALLTHQLHGKSCFMAEYEEENEHVFHAPAPSVFDDVRVKTAEKTCVCHTIYNLSFDFFVSFFLSSP